jgi:uncharacterized protein
LRVCLFLDHACNLRCSYCYNGHKSSRPMPMDVARAGVHMAIDAAVRPEQPVQLSFFGGEPLLHLPTMAEVCSYAREHADRAERTVRFVVVTNGTLLDADARRFIREQRMYLGVSIDGCEQAHDATRCFVDGGPSYRQVTGNVRAWIDEGGGTGLKVIAVVDPRNVRWMADSFDALLDLGVRNVSMNINYEADWDDAARDAFTAALEQLGDRYMAAWRADTGFTLNLLDSKIVTHLKGGYACADRCDFGCEEVAVAPSGRLYPCDRLVGEDNRDDVVIGDVFTGVDPVRRDALIATKNEVLRDCGDCALLHRCMHWCGCVNHAMTGSVGGVDGLLCWFEQRIIEQADRCAAALYEEKNAGFLRRFYVPRIRR